MLVWLRARNVALLEDVSVGFGEGLNVVTGETGVGKSLLLGALGLILGGRARAQLVGPASDRAVVEAGFEIGPETVETLTAAFARAGLGDLEGLDEGELVIRREVRGGAGQRGVGNRVAINGAPGPVAAARAVGRCLAEIYSQGEHLALLRPGAARETVDAAGDHRDAVSEVAAAHRILLEAERRRADLEERLVRSETERRDMRRAAEEIERAAPAPDERAALAAERRILGDADRLLSELDAAWEALYGAELSAGAQIAVAARALERGASIDPTIAALLEGRPDLAAEVEDLADEVRSRRAKIRAGPERLAEIEDRLALLRRLERRYGGESDELVELARRYRTALAELDEQAEARGRAVEAAAAGARAYRAAAARLTAARRDTAATLAQAVERELAGLGIPRARFEVAVEPLDGADAGLERATEHGLDRVEFLFSAAPELPPAPIGQVASGGESSRFFLALKAAGASARGPATLLFDEADAGTSGRIADAVGRRLLQLAADRQVIAITHLPQVAALGRTHLVVEKLESGSSVRVRRLSRGERIEEVARMLAGPEVGASARHHARELLEGVAGGMRPPPRAPKDS